MKKMMKRHAGIMVIALVLTLGIFLGTGEKKANAATRKCYTIATSNTRVYSSGNLSYGIGWIYASDEVTVNTVTDRYCYVKYPISGGKTKTGYIATSAILTGTTGSSCRSCGRITTYRRPGGATYGYVDNGDTVTILGMKGNYTQIKYPVSGGYKYAFITSSNANSYLNSNSNANSNSSGWIQEGDYIITSLANTNYAIEIYKGWEDNCTNVQLYQKHGATNQIFHFRQDNQGYYIITNKKTGKNLDVYKGGKSNGTNVIQYEDNGGDNQKWQAFITKGGFMFRNKANGLMLDLCGGRAYDEANINTWEYNGATAQKWKLIPVENSNNSSNTASSVQAAIYRVAMNSVGTTASTYQKWGGRGSGTAWCVLYATWVANQGMIQSGRYNSTTAQSVVPKEAGTSYLARWFDKRDRYHALVSWQTQEVKVTKNTSINSYQPQVGDLAIIDNNGYISSGPDHTGIVIESSANQIKVAEGNTGKNYTTDNRPVKVYTYTKGGSYWVRTDYQVAKIVGFGNPAY